MRYGLSYRDVEELLAECGVEVDHITIYRWVQMCGGLALHALASGISGLIDGNDLSDS